MNVPKLIIQTIILFLSLNPVSQGQEERKTIIKGYVADTENNPLAYVNVFLENSFDGAMTKENGSFEFSTSLTGEFKIIASLIGYKKYSEKFSAVGLNNKPIKIVMIPKAVTTNEVVVTASSFSSDKEKGVMVTSMDIMTTPGGAADIFQSLKTMPGITQVSESAELYVRGGDPYETLTLFDQATINHPYTFESAYGGLFSNININSIDDMYFSSGGFSSRYGNVLSGILALESKDEPESRQINVGLSLAGADLNAAIPVDNNLGFRITARQNFTEPVFWLNGGKDDFTLMPLSKDINASASYKFSETGRIKIFGQAAYDRQGVNIELPGYTDQFNGISNSSFFNLQIKDILFENLIFKSSISKSGYTNHWKLGVLDIKKKDDGLKTRTDMEYISGKNFKILGGFEIETRSAEYTGTIPEKDYDLRKEAGGKIIDADFDINRIGGYLEIEKSGLFNIDNLFLIGGIRYDYIDQLNLAWLDPRINTGFKLNDNSAFSFGWGIFHQHPDPRLYAQTDGNPNLKAMRADHFILSYDYKFNNNNFRLEAYYKDYTNLPLEDAAINYNNAGYGYAKGIDILFKGDITDNLSGWISYGFINTKRKWMDYEEFTSSGFDITHNITVIAKYNISPEFQIGMNYKYATGKPFTPVISSILIEELNVYEPIFGLDNSARYPDYNRLDIRFTYLTNLLDKWFTIVYIEGLNILNIKNIFDYSYNFDYSERKEIKSYFGRRTVVFGMIINL